MRVYETRIEEFLGKSDTAFVIPVYQRNYDWTRSQCDRMLADILSAGDQDDILGHFFGTLVHIRDDMDAASDLIELTIIDGQQRLTTLTLLFMAMFHHASENAGGAERIKQKYLVNQFSIEDDNLKLKTSAEGRETLAGLMDPEIDNAIQGHTRFIHNFNFFRKQINKDNFETIMKGIKKLIIVEIGLDRGRDNPQRIFESLNSTGLDLSQADLIRNYILMELPPADQENRFHSYWNPIEKNTRDIDTNTEKVSDFVRDFLIIKRNTTISKNAVYEEFKKMYPYSNSPEMTEALDELLEFSRLYTKILNPGKEDDPDVRGELTYIKNFEVSLAHPFLMRVYRDFDNKRIDRDAFIEVMRLIQSYIMRRFIIDLERGRTSNVFARLYKSVDEDRYVESIGEELMKLRGVARFPRDKDVVPSLKRMDMYNAKSRTRDYFFGKLENHKNREPVDVFAREIIVERIFPRNPVPAWREGMSGDDFAKMRDEYLNTIGNLTLSGNNGNLGNKTFAEKREMNIDGGEQGYRYSRLWLNRDLKDLSAWGPAEVDKRTQRMVRRFLDIWRIPPEPETHMISGEVEGNIFNVGEPQGHKLVGAVFMGERLDVSSFTSLYEKIFRQLMILHPEILQGTNLGKEVRLSLNKDDFLRPMPVVDGYYIETNISANAMFRRLKIVLGALDMDDELFVKLVLKEES